MYKRPESRGPAAPLPGAGQGQDSPGCSHTHTHTRSPQPPSLSGSGAAVAHARSPRTGRGSSLSVFALRHFRKSVPTGTRGAGGLLLSMQLLEPPRGLGRGASPATLQHTPVRRAHDSSCSGGTQAHSEGSGREAAATVHRDPAHATQAAQNPAGGEKRLLLVFPQQSRNKQTMATGPLCSEAQDRGAEGAEPGQLPRNQAQVWLSCDSDIALLEAVRPAGPGAQSTARLWLLVSRASPAPGCWLNGCFPGLGSLAGAGHSFSSCGSGCACDSPACSGGKQAGGSSSWLEKTKSSPMKERGKRSGPLSAELRRLKSIHVRRCSLFG